LECGFFMGEEIVPKYQPALGRSVLRPGKNHHPVAPCLFLRVSSNEKFVVPQLSKSRFRAVNTPSEMLPDT